MCKTKKNQTCLEIKKNIQFLQGGGERKSIQLSVIGDFKKIQYSNGKIFKWLQRRAT